MAKQYEDKANWLEVDPSTLSPKQITAYEQYKALYKQMKAAKMQFETLMQEGVPSGKRMIFGYFFGKLSVAIVEAIHKESKAPKVEKLTLAQFLAQAQSTGTRN